MEAAARMRSEEQIIYNFVSKVKIYNLWSCRPTRLALSNIDYPLKDSFLSILFFQFFSLHFEIVLLSY